ncbi:MAG: RsmB/NOP family class I SAM-dependent RNA methyltransferase [Tepidibacter sp.]|jgi:NOL1/NOP2/sun family putative RNA methylase|uniref:RsmF rRNA methyltransferase first C-terminal domain-containing protein n=1 Tax=Tepidibacter sp. TaxID=2529387 RepID=UPI0025E47F55|nr:RsmB/NOP family class I SAM-dependent RNA methyltransferase [Tepidibacter sp.]MCT4508143.1 RsmB/NOP family class I SAM-dependent RNA methyltransferase [Tepidibacter sp.]
MKLPIKFLDNMKEILNDEFDSFFKSYDEKRYYGLRVNTLKTSVEKFLNISPFNLDKIPWSSDGFYYEEGVRPAKSPFYNAGLYYIQEPSAMSPVEFLDIKKGHKVLDLCAAPGGKSIQIASGLQGEGMLVTNDINSSRVKPLVKNIEMYGVSNVLVVNDSPSRLCNNFEGFFDRVLVDAPCSGEGMFRKDEKLIKSWEKEDISIYPNMQREILDEAGKMLKGGGKLVYSTCTFNKDENENMIKEFLDNNDNFELLNIEKIGGISEGLGLKEVGRLWPHKLNGEGHFLALLQKVDGYNKEHKNLKNKKKPECFEEFEKENMNTTLNGNFITINDNLYLAPKDMIQTKNLKAVRTGLLLGKVIKKRFKPSQALAMALKKEDFKRVINLDSDDSNVIKYLKGETIFTEGENGLNLVCVNGHPLGFGKLNRGTLKNGYEKSWRWI